MAFGYSCNWCGCLAKGKNAVKGNSLHRAVESSSIPTDEQITKAIRDRFGI